MQNNRPDDVKFLINAFSLAIIVVAILVTFQPYLENEPRIEEVRQVEQHFITPDIAELAQLTKSDGKKPVMLVAFASWCYYCRQVMPEIVGMMRNHEIDGITPVFISLDDEPRKLSRYLVHNEYNKSFNPYVIGRGHSGEITNVMQPSGSSFSGVIPYIGFFDKNGKISAQSIGVVDRQTLSLMVSKVKE